MFKTLVKIMLSIALVSGLAVYDFAVHPQQASARYMGLYSMPRGGNYNYHTENQIVWLVNRERVKRHLRPLKVSNTLRTYARDQSRNQWIRKYMYHGLLSFPYYSWGGQNVGFAAGTTHYDSWPSLLSAQEMMKMWMASPHHRANILNKRYKYIGVGVASGLHKLDRNGLDRWVFFTQDFSN